MSFHARLRELREAANLSQAQLAKRAGMSKGGVADLEQNRRKPAWETVQKLCKALGVSCETFNEEAESEELRGRGRPRKGDGESGSDAVKPAPKRKKDKGA